MTTGLVTGLWLIIGCHHAVTNCSTHTNFYFLESTHGKVIRCVKDSYSH